MTGRPKKDAVLTAVDHNTAKNVDLLISNQLFVVTYQGQMARVRTYSVLQFQRDPSLDSYQTLVFNTQTLAKKKAQQLNQLFGCEDFSYHTLEI